MKISPGGAAVTSNQPLPHAEYIKAFADGIAVQMRLTYMQDSWSTVDALRQFDVEGAEFRLAPQPRVPRERWFNEYPASSHGYPNEAMAKHHAQPHCLGQVLFREVIEKNDK